MRNSIFFFLVLLVSPIFSQVSYPQDYFTNPLKIPLILSGTFGELRSNHFHSGLDIKTQQREGLDVVAAADGYISRIKIQEWGYGKALYITHPKGYTTVYGHLQKFAPEIEQYVKEAQYNNKSYEIELHPKPTQLPVKKGMLIAYSGNSGGSGGPHLHFEIRNSQAHPLNPFLFGIKIPDSRPPLIRACVVYALDDSTHINGSNKLNVLRLRKSGKNLLTNPITAHGTIGFGVNAVDKLDQTYNNNGIYSLEVTVNGKTVYKHQMDKTNFSTTRYINTLIDYGRYVRTRQKIQKAFKIPANKLKIYKTLKDNGYIKIEDGKNYTVAITAKDFSGNSTTLTIPVKGEKNPEFEKIPVAKTAHFFKANEYHKINRDIVGVSFPSNCFYEDLYFNFNYKDDIVQLHDKSIPLHKNFSLSFNVSSYPEKEQRHLVVARVNKKGKLSYSNTKRAKNKIYTRSRTLGKFTITKDTIAPSIYAINFRNNTWVSNYSHLKFKLKDNFSGVKSYTGTLNGQWMLLEYDAKKNKLVYDLNDIPLDKEKNKIVITAEDNAYNRSTYTIVFNKKINKK
ncbi:MAG: peptidase M23 [Flavobacteriales bacterium]|nr:MAG: peptidase M23 [Flavobacteriales bacterium]PIE48603.1 MAG: peptidase M23 [Flavobacteriales bacterium]